MSQDYGSWQGNGQQQPQGSRPPVVPEAFRDRAPAPRQAYAPQDRPQFTRQPQPFQTPQQQPGQRALGPRRLLLTTAEGFWYVLMCIPTGAGYFAKIPAKKALADFGMAEMTVAEQFWYVVMCIPFGGAYFLKIPVKKALSEMRQAA
jgi:hypothetical protein